MVSKKDNGKHKGWFKNTNNPHNPLHGVVSNNSKDQGNGNSSHSKGNNSNHKGNSNGKVKKK